MPISIKKMTFPIYYWVLWAVSCPVFHIFLIPVMENAVLPQIVHHDNSPFFASIIQVTFSHIFVCLLWNMIGLLDGTQGDGDLSWCSRAINEQSERQALTPPSPYQLSFQVACTRMLLPAMKVMLALGGPFSEIAHHA